MKKTSTLFLLLMFFITGCSSVTHLNSESGSGCNVQVYTDKASALANGEIVELCVISGTSAWSYSHTVATAINKHKHKACECGAKNVYIQAQDAGTLGTASVTMVGFNYK